MPASSSLYILYGEDDFRVQEALSGIKASLCGDSSELANTTVLDGRNVSPEEVMTVCDTVPFFCEKRLVVVTGLLGRFEAPAKAKRSRKGENLAWQQLAQYIERIPQSTVLATIDGALTRNNPLLKLLGPLGNVKEFKPLTGAQLRQWLSRRFTERGGSISPSALRLLMDLAGSNLHLLSNEIEKLCLYANGRMIEEADVRELVPAARELNVFEMVDSILERKPKRALFLMRSLQDEGAAAPYLVFMIARQVRQLILAKSMLDQNKAPSAVGRNLGISSDYVLDKMLGQARQHSLQELRGIYSKLLATDVGIKTGAFRGDKGELALSLFVSELTQ